MKNTIVAFIISTIVFIAPAGVFAETVLRDGNSVSLAVDQRVEGDFYGYASNGFIPLSGPVALSGTIEGDAYVLGGSITSNGVIEGDLFALGGVTQVHASVTDDVRIVAGNVTIAEEVGGDVFVMGGSLTILSSAHIKGNVFFYGLEAEINGQVDGSVFGTAESLRIDGPVGGNVDVRTGQYLVLGGRTDIAGDVRYESQRELTRAQNAVVVGDIVRNSEQTASQNPRNAVVPFLIYAFTTLIAFALFRTRIARLLVDARESFTKNGLVGLAGIFALPVMIVLLLVTVIGAIVGFLAFVGLIFLYMSSFVLASLFLGTLLQKAVVKTEKLSLLWTIIGIVALQLVLFVPFIGALILFILMAIMMGALLRSIYLNFLG